MGVHPSKIPGRPSAILLALFFTALSFLSLVFYDLNAIEYIGKKLPFPHVALTAFSAYAVGNTAGFGALSGGAIRYRVGWIRLRSRGNRRARRSNSRRWKRGG